jgi:hypothetical protein
VAYQAQKAWEEATKGPEGDGVVDALIFAVGQFYASLQYLPTCSYQVRSSGATNASIGIHGISIHPPNLCTQALLSILRVMPASLRAPDHQPKIVVVSSNGATQASHVALPCPLRATYPWALSGPHADKNAMERVLAHVGGREWAEAEPKTALLSEHWAADEMTPGLGALPDIVVVRLALLTDGECRGLYRVGEGQRDYYRISRKDVAHFIVEGALKDWARWKGQCVAIAYRC